jgi:hypothetical protein
VTSTKINTEAIIEWVHALESGDYEQTQGSLAALVDTQDGRHWKYCCLGVACVADNLDPTHADPDDMDDVADDGRYFFADNGTLPEPVSAWLGLGDDNPVLDVPDDLQGREPFYQAAEQAGRVGPEASATTLNDTYRFTFVEIARCIRFTYGLDES